MAKGQITSKCAWLLDSSYGLLLKEFLFAKKKSSLAALFRLQGFFSDLGFPLGDKGVPVLVKVFQEMYERDVLTEDCFHDWRNDIHNTTPGHDKALLQTQPWFEWLENAEEEEGAGDEEEGGGDEEELSGIIKPNNRGKLY